MKSQHSASYSTFMNIHLVSPRWKCTTCTLRQMLVLHSLSSLCCHCTAHPTPRWLMPHILTQIVFKNIHTFIRISDPLIILDVTIIYTNLAVLWSSYITWKSLQVNRILKHHFQCLKTISSLYIHHNLSNHFPTVGYSSFSMSWQLPIMQQYRPSYLCL